MALWRDAVGSNQATHMWDLPPVAPLLSDSDVHIWRADLAAAHCSGLTDEALDAAERERAARFRFEEDRRRFVASHVVLRDVLGRYLGVAPQEIVLAEGPHGKPYTETRNSSPGIRFSMSHSKDVALYAVASGFDVGVDVEFMRETVDYDGIAARFFSRAEADAVHTAAAGHKALVFFACWARKEAVVKATGLGFSLPLESFEAPTRAAAHGEFLGTVRVGNPGVSLSLLSVDPGARGYMAALASNLAAPRATYLAWSQHKVHGPAET
jgi:4'-phosphopantetheinyl transferase